MEQSNLYEIIIYSFGFINLYILYIKFNRISMKEKYLDTIFIEYLIIGN